ncbi:DUF222 domain-containing protein, partial [Mycobacterium haemophilum DSM 44634]|nr:DUF222 domain-containing protein [Mycobacterium haemophilum DSM 44634]
MRCAPGSGWCCWSAVSGCAAGYLPFALDFDALCAREWLVLLERCERVRRRIPAVEHPMINQLARQATPEELGGTLSHAIAEWTLISRAEAAKRIREAA